MSTGGFGYAITKGSSALETGLPYGAATGTTDGGFGGFSAELTDVVLVANGTLNQQALISFGYLSIHEMTVLGKELTSNFYASTNLYSYYAACSEGGREGWSQIERYGDQFDGLSVGAPAMRQAFQQPLHIWQALVETVQGYTPSDCELDQINTDLLSFCDGLDGRVDGVVSRTDLCQANFHANMSIGNAYSCAAISGGGGFGKRQAGGGSTTPAANGTVSAEAAAVAQQLLDGIFDSSGRQAWIWFRPSAGFSDDPATYDSTTGLYEPAASSIGIQFINYFLEMEESNTFNLTGKTYDTLRGYFLEGMRKFSDTLQTTSPDIEDFHASGAKILHWHGESDPSVPAGSSVWWQKSVRETMYPGQGFNESFEQLDDWYKLFLIPGAAHCGPSTDQPDGPFPADVLGPLIAWVEKGENPTTLNATVGGGSLEGTSQPICKFPLRPYFENNSTIPTCVFPSQAELDLWYPTFDAIPVTLY